MSNFKLGRLVATLGVSVKMESDTDFKKFVLESVEKYTSCDWGNTCYEDKRANDDAVKNGERILAVYIYPKSDEKIWIITEWNRSVTTILFPNEY